MKNIKSIVITGANSGIGAALSECYAEEGIVLNLLGRNQKRLESVASKCREKGAVVNIISADIRNEEVVSKWLYEIDDKYPVDLVIANAGVSGGTSEGNEPMSQVKQIFDTNLGGVLNTVHPLIPNMQSRKKGYIAIVSSVAGLRGLPGAPAYSSSKVAIKAYGEALRGFLKKDGITVSVVIPGYIKTPMTEVNDFPMPFIMEVEKAALRIQKGISKRKPVIVFPVILYLAVLLLCNLPSSVSDFIFSRLPGKSNKK